MTPMSLFDVRIAPDPLLERITSEYREMPGLRLTAAQAARLWGLERTRCDAVLRALVASGALRQTRDGRYCSARDADSRAPQPGRSRHRAA